MICAFRERLTAKDRADKIIFKQEVRDLVCTEHILLVFYIVPKCTCKYEYGYTSETYHDETYIWCI